MTKKLGNEDIKKERVFTIPNLISSIRVFLLPFFIYFSIRYSKNALDFTSLYITLGIIFLAVCSDFLDGAVARLLKQESIIGKYLDPVCDKIVTISGLVVVSIYYHFPIWILWIDVAREVLGVWLGTFLFYRRGIQGQPNLWGKAGVLFIALTIVWHILNPFLYQLHPKDAWFLHPEISAYIFLAILIGGMLSYSITYWNIVFRPQWKPETLEF